MNKSRISALLICLFLAVACAQKPSVRQIPELLRTVPTDALVVVPSSLEDGLALALDSASVLRGLDWGRLDDNDAVISFVYNSKLSPVVCVEAGRSATDTLQDVKRILGEAAGARIFAGYLPAGTSGSDRNILVACQSEAVFSAAMRHLEAGRSILDAPDFDKALELAPESGAIFIRNDGWDKILPKTYLADVFNRRDVVKFAQGACDWTIVAPDATGAEVRLCHQESGPQFAGMLESLQGDESKLVAMIPEGATFALALPIGSGFRETYRGWRYASSNLDKYDKELARLAKESGVKPLEWEKTTGVREIGLIHWGKGRKVLLVRCDKAHADSSEPEANECAGFVPALYGSAFRAVDDACRIFRDGWMICGAAEDLKAYAEAGLAQSALQPQKKCRFAIWQPGRMLAADNKGIYLINE